MAKAARDRGEGEGPLNTAPILEDHQETYLVAFKVLHSSRHMTDMGSPLAIPLSELKAYCDLYEVDDLQDRHDLVKIIQACDAAWMKIVGDQSARKDSHKSRHRQSGPPSRR